jgi:hypothetical protein
MDDGCSGIILSYRRTEKSIATYEALIWKIFSVDSRVFLKYMTPL